MMKKTRLTAIALLILIAGGIAAYLYFFQKTQPQPKPQPADIQAITPPTLLPETAKPKPQLVLEEPAEKMVLPQLEASDNFMSNALTQLLNNKGLMSIFTNDQLIRNIVVTIDNLPRKKVSMRMMPIKKAPGQFIPMESDEGIVISPMNHARYTQYVKFAEAVDAQQLVGLYIQLYPLFQASYEELGYPDHYFNDRMIEVIDDLLAAPEADPATQLVQPKYYYRYADPALESRSIGQRIMLRIGNENQQVIKAKLSDIKEALALRLHEQKVE